MGQNHTVLSVRDLVVDYETPAGRLRAVDGVSFELHAGEWFGLVGESGSGKTTLASAVLRMLRPPGRTSGGSVRLGGEELTTASAERMRELRLKSIALVAQGAMNSLNPVTRIGSQIADGIHDHEPSLSKAVVERRVGELLSDVGLAPSVRSRYPHELSGGMKQRVCIAIAISLSPNVIVADEPTSALDVVVQHEIIDTLRRVQSKVGAAVLLVGHDMGLMAQAVNRVGVMYAGSLVEVAPVEELFRAPKHPYTRLLIGSLPRLGVRAELTGIPGLPPSLVERVAECPFRARCPSAFEVCGKRQPELRKVGEEHTVACHLYEGEAV